MKGFKKPAANKNVRDYVGVVCTFTFCHQGKIASDLQLYAWCELTSALRGFNPVRTFFRLLYSFLLKRPNYPCAVTMTELSPSPSKMLETSFLLLYY